MENEDTLHKNHKQRIRQRFLEDCDFTGFSEHEILEMLLSYSCIRGNTNSTAHKLLDKFGNISNVFEARPEELITVEGIGERSASLIKMQYALFRVYSSSKYKTESHQLDLEKLTEQLKGMFFGQKQELLYMVCIDSCNKVIKLHLISRGMNRTSLDMREIFHEALSLNARSVLFAHNHPNGVLMPSEEDLVCTEFLENQLALIDVALIDHIIVAKNECFSIMKSHSFNLKRKNN